MFKMQKVMEKLTLKELAGYLPFKLKAIIPQGDIFEIEGIYSFGDVYNSSQGDVPFISIKPLLYPLSMLTQEIEHNGEKFVPMIKLAKNYAKFAGYSEDIQIYRGECLCYSKSSSKRFYLSNQGFSFDGRLVPNQLDYYFKLYEWHFDIHNLIGRGLAIDKTTIK